MPHLSDNETKLRDTPRGLRVFCNLPQRIWLLPSLAVIFGTTKRKNIVVW